MIDEILFGIMISATYDLLKLGFLEGISNPQDFTKVYEKTLRDISTKYGVTATDLKDFFKSGEFIDQLGLHVVDRNLDFKFLAKILLEYVLSSPDLPAEALLKDFFNQMERNLMEKPRLKEQLTIKYFRTIKQECDSIKENTEIIIEKQDSINSLLSQITALAASGKITANGKTLMREDYANNMDFFAEISKILNEDPLYTHELNIKGDKITYSIIPKSDDAQRLEPIHGSFSFVLGKKDGKIITLEEMLKESEKTGKPIIFDSSSIISASMYKGNIPLIPEGTNIKCIEMRAIPFELPVTVLTPGSLYGYDIVLRVEETGPTALVLSNHSSKSPIKFRFIFNLENGNIFRNDAKINVTCDTRVMDVSQALKFNRFMRDVQDGEFLILKETNSDKVIFRAHLNNADINIASQDQFDLIKKLSFIQEITGIKIHLPLEITAKDVVLIDDAYTFYKNGEVFTIPRQHELTIDFGKPYVENVEKMLSHANEDGIFEKIIAWKEKDSIKIFDIELPLGSIERFIPRAKTKKSIEELEKELSESHEDTFKVVLVPIGDDPITLRAAPQAQDS